MADPGRTHYVGDDCPGGHTDEPFACAGHGTVHCMTCARNVEEHHDG